MRGLLRCAAVAALTGLWAPDALAFGNKHHTGAAVPVAVVGPTVPVTTVGPVVTTPTRRVVVGPAVTRSFFTQTDLSTGFLGSNYYSPGFFTPDLAVPSPAVTVHRIEYVTGVNGGKGGVPPETKPELDALAKAIASFTDTQAKSTESIVRSNDRLAVAQKEVVAAQMEAAAAHKEAAAAYKEAAANTATVAELMRQNAARLNTKVAVPVAGNDLTAIHKQIAVLVAENRMDEARVLYQQAEIQFRALVEAQERARQSVR